MKKIVTIFLVVAPTIYAADPMMSIYKDTKVTITPSSPAIQEIDGVKVEQVSFQKDPFEEGTFALFTFKEEDFKPSSLSAGFSGNTQTVKLNAYNYSLDLGGNIFVPMQLYLGSAIAEPEGEKQIKDTNTDQLLDPESGVAIKFPIYYMYRKYTHSGGLCAYLNDERPENQISGHCAIGGDITFNFKRLTDTEGKNETAFGTTARLGVSGFFPFNSNNDGSNQGYIAVAARTVYAHTNINDATLLFTPIVDADGEPIKFNEYIFAGEIETKWSFNGKLAITAKYLKPFNSRTYLDSLFKVSIESDF